jgi:hypothetical protein
MFYCMKPSKKTIRIGVALTPKDQQAVALLEKRWSGRLTRPGTTEIIRKSLEIALEQAV